MKCYGGRGLATYLIKICWFGVIIPNNRMLKLINNKVSEFRNPSNFCNGNTLDNEENLISCSHGGRCIYRTKDYINTTTLVNSYLGKKLNSPNDVVVKKDGTIWFH